MFERAKAVTRSRRWATAGSLAVLLTASPVLAGCEPWPGSVPSQGGSSLPPEEALSIDCAGSSEVSATKLIKVSEHVQILRLHVKGGDYADAWRVQMFPGESDLNISNPDGQPPQRAISPEVLRGGKLSIVALTHGAVSVERKDMGLQPEPASEQSDPPIPAVVPHSPARLFDFTFTLSCAVPEDALPIQQ